MYFEWQRNTNAPIGTFLFVHINVFNIYNF